MVVTSAPHVPTIRAATVPAISSLYANAIDKLQGTSNATSTALDLNPALFWNGPPLSSSLSLDHASER